MVVFVTGTANRYSGDLPLTVSLLGNYQLSPGETLVNQWWDPDYEEHRVPIVYARFTNVTYTQPGYYVAVYWITIRDEFGVENSYSSYGSMPVIVTGYTFEVVADITTGTEELDVTFSINTDLTGIYDLMLNIYNSDTLVDIYEDYPSMPYTYRFLEEGTYTVYVTARSTSGFPYLTSQKDRYITVYPRAFIADFEADTLNGVAPFEVNFTDLSIGTPTKWFWDFENDGIDDSQEQNPIHIFTATGYYDVKLMIQRPEEPDVFTIKESYIGVFETPVAHFTYSIDSNLDPLKVNFVDTSTSMPTEWEWDFYNTGTIDSTEQNPSFTYSGYGSYTAKLTVKNIAGENSTTALITIDLIPQITMANKGSYTLMQHGIYSRHSQLDDDKNEVYFTVWTPSESLSEVSRNEIIRFKSTNQIKTVHILPLENDVYYIGSETTRWADTSTKQLNNDTTQAKTVQLHSGT